MGLTTDRDLDVWQKAMRLVEAIYALSASFPEQERFGLQSQIRRAAVSIPSNIAEGYGRQARGDYIRQLSVANGSLKEVETQIILAGQLAFVSTNETAEPWRLAQECGQLLNRLMSSLASK
jgi:four helix bundle protein